MTAPGGRGTSGGRGARTSGGRGTRAPGGRASGDRGPRPWAGWSVPDAARPAPPAWAVWGAQRCDDEARTPADPHARAAVDRLPDTIFCARPRGHPSEHASPPRRGVLPRRWTGAARAGWWSWPDDGARPDDARRERWAVFRTGTPPSTAGPGERPCAARGAVWHEMQAGRIGQAVWDEPVRCARPVGHPPPHATSPRPHRRLGARWPAEHDPDLVAAAAGRSAPRRWQWWQWPAPPLAEPTAARRLRARLVVVAAVVALALLTALVLAAVHGA